MSNVFTKYPHLERFGRTEVRDINVGHCHIFPKIDGTNASVWLGDDGEIHAGSRNRELSLEKDNAGFYAWVQENKEKFKDLFTMNPHVILYGEWLVPHTLRTYREDAWRRFYVFDVWDSAYGRFSPYFQYCTALDHFGIDYVPLLATAENPQYDDLIKLLQRSGEFLVKDGEGQGEGIVIKNYGFKNTFGRVTWAKIVSNEFKENHSKTMGAPELTTREMVEHEITERFLTDEFIKKEQSKVVTENGGEWVNQLIPQFLQRVYYEFIREESWSFIKKFKNPTIDYKTLQTMVYSRAKRFI